MTDPTPDDAGPTPGDADALETLTAGPDDLDGHTLDELADYVDRGRIPLDPTIEASPACRHAIAALERLRAVSDSLLTDDTADVEDDDDWIDAVMQRIALDARSGPDFVLDTTGAGDELLMTEGALRALIRAAGDSEPGFLVGRVRFSGDLSDPVAPLTVTIEVVTAYGTAIRAGVDRLRASVLDRLSAHTRFTSLRIDVVVRDVTAPRRSA